MRGFEDYNPIVTSIYFLIVAGIAMFCLNPLLLGLSVIGAVLLFVMLSGKYHIKSHLGFLGLFILMVLINPLFSHSGVTILFLINDRPITLEAIIYGIAAATMIMSVLYRFRSFTRIMTSDKLLYVFGKLSPKLALIVSMGLRYVPLFSRQAKKIGAAQTALGLYKDDNIIDSSRGNLRVFSILLTWALEKGIITADSMTARGYGLGRRTNFSIFKFRKKDIFLLLISLFFGVITCVSIAANTLDISFYPKIKFAELSIGSIIGLASYGVLSLLPVIIELTEKIKWTYLRSKI